MKYIFLLFSILLSFSALPCNIGPLPGQVIGLELGDSSCDGHCLKEILYFCTNKTKSEISTSYQKSIKNIIKIDFTNEVNDYEDGTVSSKTVKKLIQAGVDKKYFECDGSKECYFSEDNSDDNYLLSYALVFLEVSKLSNSELIFQHQPFNNILYIGGYGLFSL